LKLCRVINKLLTQPLNQRRAYFLRLVKANIPPRDFRQCDAGHTPAGRGLEESAPSETYRFELYKVIATAKG